MTIFRFDPDFRRAWAWGGALRGWCALAVLAAPLPLFAAENTVNLPSGQEVEIIELILEAQTDGAVWARARFLAPNLEAGLTRDEVEADFPWLCENWVLQELRRQGEQADQAIVSLSSRPIEFGDSDPDTIQFFEVFSLKGSTCTWEMF